MYYTYNMMKMKIEDSYDRISQPENQYNSYIRRGIESTFNNKKAFKNKTLIIKYPFNNNVTYTDVLHKNRPPL